MNAQYVVLRYEVWEKGSDHEVAVTDFLVRIKPKHRRPTDNVDHVTWTSNFDWSNATRYSAEEAVALALTYGGRVHCIRRARRGG